MPVKVKSVPSKPSKSGQAYPWIDWAERLAQVFHVKNVAERLGVLTKQQKAENPVLFKKASAREVREELATREIEKLPVKVEKMYLQARMEGRLAAPSKAESADELLEYMSGGLLRGEKTKLEIGPHGVLKEETELGTATQAEETTKSAAKTATEAVTDIAAINKILKDLTSEEHWVRYLEVAGGVIIGYVALRQLSSRFGPSRVAVGQGGYVVRKGSSFTRRAAAAAMVA